MWSKNLQELSRKMMQQPGCFVKSLSDEFGILITADAVAGKYVILLRPLDEAEALLEDHEMPGKELTFSSIDEMIAAGWAVD